MFIQYQHTAATSEKNLIIDSSQAQAHLEALGYKARDTIYLRSFYKGDDKRKIGDKGRSASVDNLEQLIKTVTAWQSDGRGVYFVVNGGGQADKDVTSCRAVFYEHDNLDKELQKQLWRNLGLPEPSLQIDTGGKSIHSYWILNQFIAPEQWKQLQTDLLEYADADRALKNPSRVMRLAGCWHFAPNNILSGQTQIILNTGKRYSYEELRAIIPKTKSAVTSTRELELSFGDVPLYQCLSKDDRQLIDGGAGVGERNNKGAKLARNLIGTAARLTHLGYRYSGDPRALLDDYSSRCSPPLDAREADSIWKSAAKDNPTATLSDDALINCIKAWQHQQQQGRPYQKPPLGIPLTNSNVIPHPTITRPTLSKDELLLEIDSLIEGNYLQSELEARFLELATKAGTSSGYVSKLYKSRLKEFEQSVDRKLAGRQLPTLLEAQKAELSPSQLLWGDGGKLAFLLEATAQAMPVSPEALLTTLFPVAGSRIGTSSQLVIDPRTGYTVTSIFWTCVVAPTGRLKTPAQKAIINPLNKLEANEYNNWKQAQDDYKLQLKHCAKGDELPEEPSPRKRFIVQGSTTEARMKIHSENSRGILYWRDEWAGYITGRNKYRGGKGDDSQIDLSEFNGNAISKDVVDNDKCIYLERSAISRTGNTQPEILKQFQQKQDFADYAGEFARWLFCLRENPLAYINLFQNDDGTGQQLQDELSKLYQALGKLPERDYFLTNDAKKIYQAYQHQLINWQEAEEHPGLKATYPKLQTYLGRFALWLHLVNAVLAGETTPGQFVDGQIMAVACHIIDFYVAQARLLYALNSDQHTLAGNLLKIKEFAARRGDGFTVSDLKRNINALKKIPAAEIDLDCQLLSSMGIISRAGKKYYAGNIRKNVGGVGGELVVPPTAEMITKQALEQKVGGVGGSSTTFSNEKSTSIDIKVDLEKSDIRENSTNSTNFWGEKSREQGLATTNSPPTHHQFSPTFTNDSNDYQFSPTDELTTNHHQPPPTSETSLVITKSLPTDELTTNNHQQPPTIETSLVITKGSPTDELTTNNHQQPPTTETSPVIIKGSQVRVHFPGSKRHGKTGVVIDFKKEEGLQKAIVKLENVEPSLRIWECFVPGTPEMKLELIC